MGNIVDRLLETDLRRIQLTIWPFRDRCRYRVNPITGPGGPWRESVGRATSAFLPAPARTRL